MHIGQVGDKCQSLSCGRILRTSVSESPVCARDMGRVMHQAGADRKTGLQYRKGCSQCGLPGQLGMKDLAARAPTPGHREWRPLRGWSVLGRVLRRKSGWVVPFWPGPSTHSVWLISRQLEGMMEALGDCLRARFSASRCPRPETGPCQTLIN